MITIIDLGIGNVGSISNMLRRLGVDSVVAEDGMGIASAEKIVLPGVGTFDRGMKQLDERGFRGPLNERVLGHRVPILGICLGMQLFSKRSDEGKVAGLSWIDAETILFRFEDKAERRKVPHMGWATVNVQKRHSLFDSMHEGSRFYFVHSYHVKCHQQDLVLATTEYGLEFVSAVVKENIVGTQFHPEKSHRYGLKVLENFAKA